MTENSRPWSGTATGDAGPYSDDQWTDVWKTLLGPVIAAEGVFREQLNELLASGVVTPVSIATGRALVDGSWYESDAVETIAFVSPAVNPRIDRIVLRKDWALQTIRLTKIDGAEAASPVPPAITQVDGTTWDLPLWQVHITTGGVIAINADERIFIGQYNPVGGSPTKIYFEDEFMEPENYSNGNTRRIWDALIDASGSIDVEDPESDMPAGIISFSHSGAGTPQGAELRSSFIDPVTINAHYEAIVKGDNTDAALDRYIGITDQAQDPTPNNGIFFRSVGAGNWFGVTRRAAAETTVDMGVGPTSTAKRLSFVVLGGTCVAFFLDGLFIGASITNIPAALATNMALRFGIFDTGAVANANYMKVDWMRVQGDR